MLAGNGTRAGLANGMPNGSAHDPEAMAAAHTMAEELEAMKSALHSHDAGQKELLAEQERAAAREAELRCAASTPTSVSTLAMLLPALRPRPGMSSLMSRRWLRLPSGTHNCGRCADRLMLPGW